MWAFKMVIFTIHIQGSCFLLNWCYGDVGGAVALFYRNMISVAPIQVLGKLL